MVESKVVPSLCFKEGFFFLLIFLGTCDRLLGQEVSLVNSPQRAAPFIVVISDSDQDDFIADQIKPYKDKKGTSFLVIETNGEPVEEVLDTINNRLNYNDRIDLNRCYLLVVGGMDHFKRFESLGKSIFFSKKYYLGTQQMVDTSEFKTGKLSNTSLKEVVSELSKSYLWQIDLIEIRKEYVSDLNQNSIESGILLKTNAVIPSYSGIESTIKPFFRTFTIGAYHRWGRRWQSNLEATLGLNVPGRQKIQNEIVDAGLSDDDVELDIKAHILGSLGLETRYLFQPENRRFNPYVGIYLGVSSIEATELTVEVDQDDIAAGRFDRPDGFSADDFESIAGPVLGISSGLQYSLSPKLMMDTGLRWNHDLKAITQTAEPYFNNFSFSIGFNFRFTGKKNLFYDYVNAR